MKIPVAVLDCGGQYTQMVQKACERLGYRADILPHDTPAKDLHDYNVLIIAGSPGSAFEEASPLPDKAIWALGKPILGICFGLHAIAVQFGGKLEEGIRREDGRVVTTLDTSHPIFKMVKPKTTALFTHGNFVTEVPKGFKLIGSHKINLDGGKKQTVVSAVARGNIIGVQFHPEVFDDTPDGYAIFKAFLSDIAGLQPDQKFLQSQTSDLITRLQTSIKTQAGDREVIAFVSGGVDSAVALALAQKALKPGKIHAYYIDNGFMRDEDDQVINLLQHFGLPIEKTDATEFFDRARIQLPDSSMSPPLSEVTDPETKRQIIGKAFIDIRDKLAAELDIKDSVLLQGTNAADRVESGHGKGKSTAVIKTHHNQVKEVKDLEAQGLLCEPLTDLFKDEVRNVGRALGLPAELVGRQPFPGPALAIRILCADGSEFAKQSRKVTDAINAWTVGHTKLHGRKLNTSLLPVRNVGVGGDERSHLAVLALDTDTPWPEIAALSAEATAAFKQAVNRVVVHLAGDTSPSPTITPTKLDLTARKQLRSADKIVFEEMRTHKVIKTISQCPVVLLPLSFGASGKRSIVLRPVKTLTFMTSQAMLPGTDLPLDFLKTSAKRILAEVPDISAVLLDVTNKPPATTEWE